MTDWTRDVAEIDHLIGTYAADKRERELHAAELLGVEVSAEQTRNRAHELREAEEVLAAEDQREIDALLEERGQPA